MFVTICNDFCQNNQKKMSKGFLSQLVIKTVINNIQNFTAYSHQNCQERREPVRRDNVIIMRLFQELSIF